MRHDAATLPTETATLYRPSSLVRRVNRAVGRLAAWGVTPRNTIALEVRGRRSGKMRPVALTWIDHDGDHYLVSLGGETSWVRNVRAADGRAILRHGHREEVRLVEIPNEERPPILAAYLSKWALSRSPARAAREYFGLAPYPTAAQLAPLADRYPVFRIGKSAAPESHSTPNDKPFGLRLLNRVINPAVRLILRSPMHSILSRQVLLITVTGRRSGRLITLPVQYSQRDRAVTIVVGAAERKTWWRNLVDGAPVNLRIRGTQYTGDAEIVRGRPNPDGVTVRIPNLRPSITE